MAYYKNKYWKKRKKSKSEWSSTILIVAILVIYRLYLQNKNLQNSWNEPVEKACVFGAVLIGFFFLLKIIIEFIKRKKTKQKYLNSRIYEIDNMSGEAFEELLKAHFERLGYKVALTPQSNDYGADLVLQKGGKKTIVQAKRHKAKIGNKAIQEIVAAKGHYAKSSALNDINTIQCMVVTNSYFTANARQLAEDNHVILWNRNDLIEKFKIRNI